MLTYIIIAAVIIMSASLIGVFTINKFLAHKIEDKLPFLISFSAGVFLSVAGFMLIHSLHIIDDIFVTAGFVIMGYSLAIIIEMFLPDFHHHHDDECHKHNTGKKVLIGDSIHNMVDGLVLVPAFLISPWLGIGTTVSIFIHELLQEISEFLVLKSAGYSTTKALIYNFIASSTILVGVGIGYFFSDTEVFQATLLAVSAGFFIHILFSDLLPHKRLEESEKSSEKMIIHLVLLLAGLVAFSFINLSFSHSHENHDPHHDEEIHEQHNEEVEAEKH